MPEILIAIVYFSYAMIDSTVYNVVYTHTVYERYIYMCTIYNYNKILTGNESRVIPCRTYSSNGLFCN